MSKIALSPNISGTGTLTISAPDTSTDRTLTLPDSTGTIATAESTLTQFSASGSAPVYACRAWVNFNGTGTVAIRASGNVSSITDNGTGDYTVNFTTAMPDVDYCVNGTCSGSDTPSNNVASLNTKLTGGLTTTGCRVYSTNNSSAAADRDFMAVAIFR